MKSLLALFFYICIAFVCQGQSDNTSQPVYLRFPNIPEFTIYKAPDSTAFSRKNLKKKPTVFMIFDPECDHCQHETKAIIANISKFKKAQIIMVTYLPHNEMLTFYKDFEIASYPLITMGSDPKFFFPVFYHVGSLPAIFVYDKKGNLKKSLEGSVSVDKIVEAL